MNLNIEDFVIDLDFYLKSGNFTICIVIDKDENNIVISSIEEKYQGAYPHRFSKNKIETFLFPINDLNSFIKEYNINIQNKVEEIKKRIFKRFTEF